MLAILQLILPNMVINVTELDRCVCFHISILTTTFRASLGGGGRLAQGTHPLRGILTYILFPGLLAPRGVFFLTPFGKQGRGKGLSKNISRKLVEKSRKIQKIVIMQYLIMGQCQDHYKTIITFESTSHIHYAI